MKSSTVCFLLFALTLSYGCGDRKVGSSQVLNILLQNEAGENLNQLSGLTRFEQNFVFVSQKQHRLYIADIGQTVNNGNDPLNLKPINIVGEVPVLPSWESAVIYREGQTAKVFLTHEHTGEKDQGDFHGLYYGEFQGELSALNTLTVRAIDVNLPLNQHPQIPIGDRGDFGFESLVKLKNGNVLLVSEMDGSDALIYSETGLVSPISIDRHGLRVSDFAVTSGENCFVATSFCYKHDPVCETVPEQSTLKLASFVLKQDRLVLTSQLDLTDSYISIPTLDNNDYGLFNAEGVTVLDGKFYIVNDNQPGNGVGSYLKHWPDVTIDEKQCKLGLL